MKLWVRTVYRTDRRLNVMQCALQRLTGGTHNNLSSDTFVLFSLSLLIVGYTRAKSRECRRRRATASLRCWPSFALILRSRWRAGGRRRPRCHLHYVRPISIMHKTPSSDASSPQITLLFSSNLTCLISRECLNSSYFILPQLMLQSHRRCPRAKAIMFTDIFYCFNTLSPSSVNGHFLSFSTWRGIAGNESAAVPIALKYP